MASGGRTAPKQEHVRESGRQIHGDGFLRRGEFVSGFGQQKVLNSGRQQEYTLLKNLGMGEEHFLEYLTGELYRRDSPPPSFNPNAFRSLGPIPLQDEDSSRKWGAECPKPFTRDDELNKLYLQLQQAQRHCAELRIAEKILQGRIFRST